MQVLYMFMPELPRTRHIIIGGKHIVNTAAPEVNVFHRVAEHKKQRTNNIAEKQNPRAEAGES